MDYEPFHIRQSIEDGRMPDVYVYDEFSVELRNRLGYTLNECINELNKLNNDPVYWADVCLKTIQTCNKYIHSQIPSSISNFESHTNRLYTYLMKEKDAHKLISALEIICKNLLMYTTIYPKYQGDAVDLEKIAEDKIHEINECLKTYRLGYEFLIDQQKFIKVSSKHTHKSIIKPAFGLLHDPIFKKAEEYFEKAFNQYSTGDSEDAIVSANRSFEGVMKVICDERGWKYGKGIVKELVEILFDNKLIPGFQQSYFRDLDKLLKSAIAPIRNKKGGHAIVKEEDKPGEHQVEFVLDMVASSIKLLVKYHNDRNYKFTKTLTSE